MAKGSTAGRRRTPEELSGFCAQVAMMLNSGMPLYDGMDALTRAHAGGPMERPCAEVSRLVTETGSLHEALKTSGGWPAYMVEMTLIGERTGRLEEVMNGLSVYYQREGNIRRAISGAVTYPIVLGVMMLLIVLVMILKVLPVFRSVLGGMGLDMDGSVNPLMRVGMNTGVVVLVVVGVLVIAALSCLLLMRTRARDRVMGALRAMFPPLRRVMRMISSSRVASVLSMMLSGGFPLDEALEMVPAVLDDAGARASIEALRARIAQGEGLEKAIDEAKLFDELSNSMIRTACEAGCTDAVMARIAANYEEKVEEGVGKLVIIIEPTLVGVLSVVIGAILLSVMLPMANVISSIL